jgi:predicted transcriptional regulator
MSEQRLLFPGCHARDPATSFEAAEQFKKSGKLNLHREIVLNGVRSCDGGTHSEIAAVTPLDWLQVARRLSELERAGLVKKAEPRICTVKGSKCCTWWIVENAG